MNNELVLGRESLEQINGTICILKPEIVGI